MIISSGAFLMLSSSWHTVKDAACASRAVLSRWGSVLGCWGGRPQGGGTGAQAQASWTEVIAALGEGWHASGWGTHLRAHTSGVRPGGGSAGH